MKGQTAIEYLMTYGWAILIILIVAGVLAYYGIFAPSGFLGPSSSGFAQLAVVSPWDLNAVGDLRVLLENRVGSEIHVLRVFGDGDSAIGYVNDIADVTIPAGGRSSFVTANFTNLAGNSGTTYRVYVSLEYELASSVGTLFNSTGTLSGTRS
jgi:hypothetical protein